MSLSTALTNMGHVAVEPAAVERRTRQLDHVASDVLRACTRMEDMSFPELPGAIVSRAWQQAREHLTSVASSHGLAVKGTTHSIEIYLRRSVAEDTLEVGR